MNLMVTTKQISKTKIHDIKKGNEWGKSQNTTKLKEHREPQGGGNGDTKLPKNR